MLKCQSETTASKRQNISRLQTEPRVGGFFSLPCVQTEFNCEKKFFFLKKKSDILACWMKTKCNKNSSNNIFWQAALTRKGFEPNICCYNLKENTFSLSEPRQIIFFFPIISVFSRFFSLITQEGENQGAGSSFPHPECPDFPSKQGKTLKKGGFSPLQEAMFDLGGIFTEFCINGTLSAPSVWGILGEKALGRFSQGCNENMAGLSNVNLIFQWFCLLNPCDSPKKKKRKF